MNRFLQAEVGENTIDIATVEENTFIQRALNRVGWESFYTENSRDDLICALEEIQKNRPNTEMSLSREFTLT